MQRSQPERTINASQHLIEDVEGGLSLWPASNSALLQHQHLISIK